MFGVLLVIEGRDIADRSAGGARVVGRSALGGYAVEVRNFCLIHPKDLTRFLRVRENLKRVEFCLEEQKRILVKLLTTGVSAVLFMMDRVEEKERRVT